MVRGLAAAVAAVDQAAASGASDAGDLLNCAGAAFADAAGGASGALFGALFSTIGRKLAGQDCSPAAVSTALDAGAATVARLGKAAPGDKTLLDALAPFVQEFAAAAGRDEDLAGAWRAALPAARQGAAATADMVARRGRAARLGERSRGHVDPGAQSVVYLLEAAGDVLAGFLQPGDLSEA
jgi:dihydroxyacetone kinase